jgi:NitT/TauT family transport system permease protein
MSSTSKRIPIWYPERWLSVVLFFGLWEIAPRCGELLQVFIAPPSQVVQILFEMIRDGLLWGHILVSLGRSAAGFTAAALLAIPLGFLLGSNFRIFERLVTPPLRFFAQLNPFSLFPLFILLFGIGELSKGTMIFWVCIWPILFNTINGVKGIDPLLVKSARSMGIGLVTLFFKVIFPAALPGIFTGLKMGSGTAFFMLIAAEMIGASRGLGWLVWNAQTNFQMPQLFAATVIISIFGLLLQSVFVYFERTLLGWQEKIVH